jgi:MerR family transcriptional regulator, copper efflux regulator
MSDELVTIGEAAARYGLAPSTLRWWERQGLLEPTLRRGGQRRYGPAELRRIGLIHLARNTGLMSLDQIGALLAGTSDRQHWHETVRGHIRDLDQQIERLVGAREALTHTLRCPADDPTRCRHLDDALSKVISGSPFESAPARDRFRHEQTRRDETGTAMGTDAARCKACERPLRHSHTGRPRNYCSRACQQRAYRARTRVRRDDLGELNPQTRRAFGETASAAGAPTGERRSGGLGTAT